MKTILKKELRLAMHPMNLTFLMMSAMLLIPSYPYYVCFFYTTLGIFFMCLSGRENHDVDYTMLLPVRRCDLVRGRVLMAVLVELAQMIVSIPFAILSQKINVLPNIVGMEANIALFGLSFVMLGLFNIVFFPMYYRDTTKVGMPFFVGSMVVAVYIVLAEVAAHTVYFVRRYLDTRDTVYIPQKLIVLGIGIVLFAVLTWIGCRMAEKRFEQVDL